MKKQQYKAKNGKMQWQPIYSKEFEQLVSDGCQGFCLACGETQEGCEPDARKYVCESCEQPKVYGLEELLMMGLVATFPAKTLLK